MTEQERNKQIVRNYFEQCWNQKNLNFGRHLMDDDYNFHLILPPGFPRGHAGWKFGVGMFLAAFPDCRWEIRQLIADGDLVSARTVWSGTHTGDFMGIAPTGKAVVAANADYWRLRDGKFIEHWDVVDYLAVMRQIGASMESFPPLAASIED